MTAWQLREVCPMCGAAEGERCAVMRGNGVPFTHLLPINLCHSGRVRASGARMVAAVAAGVVAPPGVDPRQLELPGTEPRR